MQTFKRSDPRAAHRRLYFTQVDEANLQTRETGASGWTVHVVKPGGTDAAGAGSVGEQDATDAVGLLYYEFSAAELNTPGAGVVRLSKAGQETREMPFSVEQSFTGTAATGTLSTTAFTSSLTQANDYFNRQFVRWLSGSLEGQVGKIGDFANSSGLVTLVNGQAFTAAPSDGDVFEIF